MSRPSLWTRSRRDALQPGPRLPVQDKLDEAAAHYEQAIVLKPDLAEAHNNLGNILWDRASSTRRPPIQQAIALRPDIAEVHNNLGSISGCRTSSTRPWPASRRRWRSARAIPKRTKTWQRPGRAGKLDEAAAHYEQAWLSSRTTPKRITIARISKSFARAIADLAALEALAAAGRLPPGKMLYVHFALGKALEDVGDNERAFEHLLQGNALKRREVHYNEAAYQRTFQAIADGSTQACWIACEGWAIPRPFQFSSSACPVPAARSLSRFWPATRRSTPPAN